MILLVGCSNIENKPSFKSVDNIDTGFTYLEDKIVFISGGTPIFNLDSIDLDYVMIDEIMRYGQECKYLDGEVLQICFENETNRICLINPKCK